MKTATLIYGKVKYKAGKPKDYGNGERINIVVTPDSGGDDIKVWGNPGDAIAYLSKGDSVTLAHDGKSYTLLAVPDQATNGNGSPSSPHPTHPPTPGAVAVATPASIPPKSADVQEWIAIFEELRAALPQAQEQTWRAAASTLFITRCRIRSDHDQEAF